MKILYIDASTKNVKDKQGGEIPLSFLRGEIIHRAKQGRAGELELDGHDGLDIIEDFAKQRIAFKGDPPLRVLTTEDRAFLEKKLRPGASKAKSDGVEQEIFEPQYVYKNYNEIIINVGNVGKDGCLHEELRELARKSRLSSFGSTKITLTGNVSRENRALAEELGGNFRNFNEYASASPSYKDLLPENSKKGCIGMLVTALTFGLVR